MDVRRPPSVRRLTSSELHPDRLREHCASQAPASWPSRSPNRERYRSRSTALPGRDVAGGSGGRAVALHNRGILRRPSQDHPLRSACTTMQVNYSSNDAVYLSDGNAGVSRRAHPPASTTFTRCCTSSLTATQPWSAPTSSTLTRRCPLRWAAAHGSPRRTVLIAVGADVVDWTPRPARRCRHHEQRESVLGAPPAVDVVMTQTRCAGVRVVSTGHEAEARPPKPPAVIPALSTLGHMSIGARSCGQR